MATHVVKEGGKAPAPDKTSGGAGGVAGSNADAAQQAKRARAMIRAGDITDRWKTKTQNLFNLQQPVSTTLKASEFRVLAYELISEGAKNGMIVDTGKIAVDETQIIFEVLAAEKDREPFLRELAAAVQAQSRDTAHFDAIGAALDNVMHGGDIRWNTKDLLAQYAQLSNDGRRWIGKSSKTLELKKYLTSGKCQEHGALEATHTVADKRKDAVTISRGVAGGGARIQLCAPILNMLERGALGVAGVEEKEHDKAKPAGEAEKPDEKKPDPVEVAANALLDRIKKAIKEHSVVKHEERTLHKATLKQLFTDIEAADEKVKDRLYANPALMHELMQLDPGQMKQVIAKLDTVQGLYETLEQWAPEPPRSPSGMNMSEHVRVPLDAKVYPTLEKFLTDRPGKEMAAARMRVLQHEQLKARYIDNLQDAQRKNIYKLVANGTLVPTMLDKLRDAASAGRAAEAAEALMKIGSESPADLAALRDDPIFRKEIENVDKEVDVSGFKVNPYHLCLTFWGLEPLNTKDVTVDERQQMVNPNEKFGPDGKTLTPPLTIEEQMELEANLLDPYATKLRSEIHERVVDDDDMEDICQAFECACKPYLKHFETMKKAPGPALTEYYNKKYKGHDLRGEVNEYVSGKEMVECERILGFRVDSATVGIINGQVAELGAPKGPQNGKVYVGLAQALRGTYDDKGVPLSQRTSDYAQQLCSWMYEVQGMPPTMMMMGGGAMDLKIPSVNKDELLESWHKYRDLIQGKAKEIAYKTTLAPTQIHPIELLRNAVQEKGGDLAGKIKRFYGERYGGAIKDQSAAILADMGLRAEDDKERAKAANEAQLAKEPEKGLEQQAKERWAEPATQLFESIAKLPVSLDVALLTPIATSFKQLEIQKIEGAPHVAGPKTQSIEERPPRSFVGYYRLEYGIDPRTHVTRVLKSHVDRGKDVSAAAQLFGVEVGAAIEAPKGDALEINKDNQHLVRHNFTEETARTVARQLWNAFHEGTRLNAVITKLYTDYSDEEQRLIRMGFRELSGGIDIQFYLQQKLLQKRTDGVTAIGAEGTAQTKGAGFTQGEIKIGDRDAIELQTAVTAAQQGTVDTYAMMKSAAAKADVDGIMRLADETEQADRAKILQDHELMDKLRSVCDAIAWDRVYKTLTNQADLVDRLYQRGGGLGTDEKGMREDVKAHVKRLRKRFTKQLQAEEEAKDPTQRRGAEAVKKLAEQMVREECQRLMTNISVRRIIEEELSGDELSDLESLVLNAGETTTQSDVLRSGKDAETIIAGIRNTDPKERARLRGDAAYLERLAERLRNPNDYRAAMDALMSDRPGEDTLSKIDENATKDKSRTMLRDLVELSPQELKKLQADPELQAKLLASFDDPEKRALARKILTAKMEEPDPKLKTGEMTQEKAVALQEQAETERIKFLIENAKNRIMVPVVDKLGWPTMLEQCIEVYKMELEKRVWTEEQGQRVLASFDMKESQQDRRQRESTSAQIRQQIWHKVEKDVAVWAFATEKDKPRRTLSEVWTANAMIDVVRNAVLKKRDPSAERMRENLGATVDMPDVGGMPGSTHEVELDDDHDGLKNTIRGASNELLVDEWSNVKQKSLTNGPSLAEVYAEYKQAEKAAQGHGELQPTREAELNAENKRLAFMNYTLDVSTAFEEMLLPHVGPSDERKLTKHGGTGPLKDRDNKKYNELLDLARERVVKLTKGDARFLVARAIHIDPANEADFKLLDTTNRDAVTGFAYRDSKYLRSRGTQAGSGWAADAEAKFLDQRMMQYGHDVAATQTNEGPEGKGIITEAEGARLEERGEEMERALQAFKDAKAKVAFWMSMIIGVLVTAVLTVLTGGLATGPLAALFFTTAIAGVSAGAKALVNEAVLAEDYDLKDEGVKMIGKEMLTAFITAGTTMMAQKFVSSVAGVTKLGRQARVMEQVTNNPPPLWQSFLHQASEEVVSEGMSGVIDAGLTAIDPVYWMHGMAEGRDRALPQMWQQLEAVPMQALKGGITSMITAGVMRMGKKKELQALSHQAGRKGTVNIRENFKKVFGGNTERVIAVFVEWSVNKVGSTKIDLDAVPGELLEGFLQEVSETSVETHTESAHEGSRTRRAEKDIEKHKDKLTKSERDGFLEMQSRASSTDPYVTVGEFIHARQERARDSLLAWTEANPGKTLTPAQMSAYVMWVRDAPDANILRERLQTNPETVPEVIRAKDTKPDVQTDAKTDADGKPKAGAHVGTQTDGAPAKEPPVQVVKTVSSIEDGYALMRKLAGGDGSEVGHEGASDKIEWGLGRKADGTLVVLKGKQGEVDFDHIPGIVALAHSHPAEMDGKRRDLATVGKQPGGVPITELMNDKNSNDLVKFLPSTGDLGYFADNSIGQHVVFTPYVHMGDGRIGNPNQAVPPSQRIEIVVNNAKLAGRSAIQKHQPAYTATIIIRTGDGKVLWTGPMFAVKIAGGSFRADQPSLSPDMIELGTLPDARPVDDDPKAEAGTHNPDSVVAKYGTRNGDKTGDKNKHADTKHQAPGHAGDQAPGATKPRTAAEVFAGVTPVQGELWTFQSVSNHFYTGRFQGIDETGHIVLVTADGAGRLEPMRITSARRGPSVPELHAYGPHDRVTLVSVNNNPRTGTIQGYDEAGNVVFRTDHGEIQIIPPKNLKLDLTRPARDAHAQHHQDTKQEQAAQQQAAQQQQQAGAQQQQQPQVQQQVARTAADVFAGQRPVIGQMWSFHSVSTNDYQGRFQGIDEQGKILVETRQGIAHLDPQRIVTARVGVAVPALQHFAPTDRVTVYGVDGSSRTGFIVGYDEHGNIHFQSERSVLILRPDQLDLTRTERAPEPQQHTNTDPNRQQQQQQQQAPAPDAAQQAQSQARPAGEVQRDIQRDIPTVAHLYGMPDHVIGAHQASRVPAALRALSDADYQMVRAIHDSLQNPTARAFLLKAVAAHNSITDLQWLAAEMAGKDDAWLADALTLGDPRGTGVGVKQQWSMSCNASTTVTLRGNYDPVFALKIRYANPSISQVDPNNPLAYNNHLASVEAQLLQSPYQGQSHPELQGQSGIAAPHAAGATKGRWADDILSRQQDVTGMTFGTHKNPRPDQALATIDRAVSQGMQVPIVIGDFAGAHTHYVLVMGRRRGADGFEYSIHNTGDGTTTWVTAAQLYYGQLPLAGGRMVTAMEVPTATPHPDQQQQPQQAQVAVDPQTQQQVPTAGAGAKTQPMAAVKVEDAPAIAATAVAVVSEQLPQSSLAARLQPSGEQSPVAQGEHKNTDDATSVPPQVANAVQMIVHGRAFHAAQQLQALEAKAAAATAQQAGQQQQQKPGAQQDAELDAFTQSWKGAPADLQQFREFFDVGYEDAIDKVRRAMQDPQVAALLSRIPEDELAAIVLYTQTYYTEMNDALRKRDREGMKEFGNAIKLADKGLSKLPVHEGWVHRGVDSLPEAVLAKYVPGVLVTEEAFTSTSQVESGAFKGKVKFNILSKSGRDVRQLSRVEAEKEVLFRPGTKFIVVDKVRDGDATVITMEEVSEAPGGAGGPGGVHRDGAATTQVEDRPSAPQRGEARASEESIEGGTAGRDVYRIPYTEAPKKGKGGGVDPKRVQKAVLDIVEGQSLDGGALIHNATLARVGAKQDQVQLSVPNLVNPDAGPISVNVKVLVEAATDDMWTAAESPDIHGGDGGPARHRGLARDGQGKWSVNIHVNSGLSNADVPLAVRHELDEIADIVARNPNGGPSDVERETRAGVFATGERATIPTSHDRAAARELKGMYDVLLNEQRAYKPDRDAIADHQARVDRMLTAMGLSDPALISAEQRALLEDSDLDDQLLQDIYRGGPAERRSNNYRREVADFRDAQPMMSSENARTAGGHGRSKHWENAKTRDVVLSILNNPARVFTGRYEGSNRAVDIYWVDGSVVVTEAGQKDVVITAYGPAIEGPAGKRTEVTRWLGRPGYQEVAR